MTHPALESPPKIGAGLVALLMLIGAAFWAKKAYRITHPSFPTRVVETRSYRAAYPADWEPIDTTDPKIGEKEVVFMNHRAQEGDFGPWDQPRLHMTLRDEATGYADLAALTGSMLKDAEKPGVIETWQLANGVKVKTWVEHPITTDLPSIMRWLAFKGANGRYYSAAFPIPADWKTRGRYEFIFKSILGSMEFKTAGK